MKKTFSILIIFAICFVSTAFMVVCADNNFNLKLECVDAKPGDIVEVDIVLENNPGIVAMLFDLTYDDRLQLVDVKDGGIVDGAFFGKDYSAKPYKMLWNSASYSNFCDDGTLVTLYFKVADDAVDGEASVCLQYNRKNIYNVDLSFVDINLINGMVRIKSDVIEEEVTVSGNSNKNDMIFIVPPYDGKINNSDSSHESEYTDIDIGNVNADEDKIYAFTDVDTEDWFYDSVKYVYNSKLMKGVNLTEFAPNSNLTRAMLVTILYRIDGSPESDTCIFADVESDLWYSDAVSWAANNKIVNGIGNNMFAPDIYITREQIALVLHNFAKYKNIGTNTLGDISGFADHNDVSEWAVDAIIWATSCGIIQGKDGNCIDARGNATRAEAATMFMRFIKENKFL